MINRNNYRLIQTYHAYRREVHQISQKTSTAENNWLRHLLIWADATSFKEAPSIRPTLPDYLKNARRDGKAEALSYEYRRKILVVARHFFTWLLRNTKQSKSDLSENWVETLRLSKTARLAAKSLKTYNKDHITYEDVLAIAKTPVTSLKEERIRAGACFLFASGMRIAAFVTLPIHAIDLTQNTLFQSPTIGVETKNSITATTYLFEIPGIHEVILAWDAKVRALLPAEAPWYANISPKTLEIDPDNITRRSNRHHNFRKQLRAWMKKNNLTYHHPHSFRHGHAMFGIERAEDYADIKAISQNLMHSSVEITDRNYGVLSRSSVKEHIAKISRLANPNQASDIMNSPMAQELFAVLQKYQ